MVSLAKRLAARDWVVMLGLGLVAAVLMGSYWGPPARYGDSDALFYKAQALEVQGTPKEEAIATVFSGPLADELKESEADLPARERNVENAEWVDYSTQFYRRRWTIPVAAAAVEPVLGDESLETISLLGYVAATMLLYLFLRRRFSPFVSIMVTLAALLVPSLRLAAADGTTDTWGLAGLLGALLCAALALERGARWVWPWAALVLLVSFTRDVTIVLVLAAAAVVLLQRSRTSKLLLISAVVAALPAPLLAGAPLKASLASAIDGFNVPADESWGYVLSHYPGQIWDVVSHDLTYPLDFSFPLPMFLELAVILAGIATLAAYPARGDALIWMMRGAFLGAFATLLAAALYSTWKVELAMLPSIAVGVALLMELVIERLPNWLWGDRLRLLAKREPAPT